MPLSITPGPWDVQRDGTGLLHIASAVSPDPGTNARYLWVALINPTKSDNPLWRQEEESEANARAIAALQELIVALKALLKESETNEDTSDDCIAAEDDARAALRKAGAL